MKKIISIILCLAIFSIMVYPAYAAIPAQLETESNQIVLAKETRSISSNINITDTITLISQTRSTITASMQREITVSGVIAAIITIQGTFSYNGSSVSVISKSVTQTDTYNGWSYSQISFTSSGGTISLTGKVTKLLILSNTFTMSLSCDKNGNISYS